MKRILAISDIHGMYEKFIDLLELVKYNPDEDKLILLGDYIDRGPEPIKVLQKVIELSEQGAIALIGNHEDMFLQAWMQNETSSYSNALSLHYHNGGYDIWNQFKELSSMEQTRMLKTLITFPTIMEIENYIFVHAGVNYSVSIEDQDLETLVWSRDEFIYSDNPLDKLIVFGHTPTKYMGCPNKIWKGNGKIGIDCGAVFGGKLACLELPSMQEYYV